MKKNLFRSLLVSVALTAGANAWAQKAPTAGVEVAAGEFYLYNIGAGTYLAHGSSYGTHATVDGQGDVITLAGEGNYTIHHDGIADNAFLGNGGWVDCATTRDDYSTFTFEPANKDGYTNIYKIKADNGGAYLNWMGGGGRWTNEVRFEAVDNEDWGLWLVIPKATRLDTSAAAEDNPVDVTYLITNPDFEANANDNNTEVKGWTTGFKKQFNGAEGMSAVFLESWTASTGTLSDFTAEQTLKNLPAGIYKLSVKAAAINQADGTVVPEGFTMFAGSTPSQPIGALDTYSITFVSTGTDVTIGMKTVSANVNWVRFDNFRLAYMGVDLSILKDSYASLSAKAAELDGQTMSKVAQDALTAAISETATVEETEEALSAAIDKLTAAIQAAEKSIAAYANAAKYLPINKAELEGTNLYTWDAYKQYISDAEDGLKDGTLSDELAAKMTDISTGWRAANYIDDILMSAWDEKVENWDSYHVNTWSTEGDNDGSNFKVPFIEYWTGDGESLAAKTLTATIDGLKDGDVYDVKAWVRVRIKNGAEAPATGITLQVNNGETVDVCAGDQVGTSQFYLKEYTATGAVSDGKLQVKFNVAGGNNVSWMSFKNVFFTYNEEATAIKSVAAEQAAQQGIYNLAGLRVEKAVKGLYIINGKKVIK